jgi:TPR repeat protein
MRRLCGFALGFALLTGAAAAQTGGLRPSQDAAPVAAREPDLAYGAYQRGLYITGLREATARLARDPEDAAAMTLLGELHNQGLGARQDPAKAAEWYRLAAKRGDARALAALGLMAIDGRGMDKNLGQGKAWLEEAARKGEPAASYNLALLLLTTGAQADLLRAVELLRIAAEAEIGDAQHALGALYLRGRGVTRDPAEAARWFFKAAGNGSLAGEVEYAILLFNGEGVPKNEALAARYFRHAASNGNAIAQNRLARLYAAGRGVPKNLVEAAAWHLVASSQGLPDTWLDGALRDVSLEDRARAERLAAERAGVL